MLRVYPMPGQRGRLLRFVTLRFVAHTAGLRVRVGPKPPVRVDVSANLDVPASVCVPAGRPAILRIRGVGSGRVYGDLGTPAGIGASRIRGVQLERVSLADETGAC